jgi:TIR domain-containing protein
MRTLYLQSTLSINGRQSLKGRRLFDRLRNVSDDCLLAHAVSSNPTDDPPADPRIADDVVSHSLLREFDPTVIYVEGGLFATDEGRWRVPRLLVEDLVTQGTVLVIADADVNALREHKTHYQKAGTLIRALADYGPHDELDPEYGADETSFWKGHRQIVCKPSEMVFSKWLRPIYAGIDEILVGLPAKLAAWDDLLASGNQGTTGCLRQDAWTDPHGCCPFASASRKGNGFIVFLAGHVSSDVWLERCPANTDWLVNICQFLESEALAEKARSASHLRSPHLVFLSHRSVDKDLVREVSKSLKRNGVGVWLDEEQLIPSDSLVAGIDKGLTDMSHFALFWSEACVGASWVERELHSAVARLVNAHIPLLVVRLDETPVPTVIGDIFRIEAAGMPSIEIGISIARAVDRLVKRDRQ